MLRAVHRQHTLQFSFPAGTSRGTMHERETWFILVYDTEDPSVIGIGECAPLKGLSIDDRPEFNAKLGSICDRVDNWEAYTSGLYTHYPAIHFGLEMAFRDLESGGSKLLYPSEFTEGREGIPINGLIWMASKEEMHRQIKDKVDRGFRCIKIKIGALPLEKELALLRKVRAEYGDLELRVDANGAFAPDNAMQLLESLGELGVHSIEQPIPTGQPEAMASLCRASPVPIALDEELIGIPGREAKRNLLETIRPAYIVIKPTLVGGIRGGREWIEAADHVGAGWWITSALESDLGLNAIAQWVHSFQNDLYQGLGTGQLFTNNLGSPLNVRDGKLWHDPEASWDLSPIGK